jgi:hypothetical protein
MGRAFSDEGSGSDPGYEKESWTSGENRTGCNTATCGQTRSQTLDGETGQENH